MMPPLRQFVLAAAAVLSVMAGPGNRHLRAQSPPRPAVTLTQLPRFYSATMAADFNEDGHLDLIGAAMNATAFPPTPDLTIAFGRGDGTFNAAHSLDVPALPLAVGDFNHDGHADVLLGLDGPAILAGRGDGTFRAVRTIDSTPTPSNDVISFRAVAADFNGDGKLDFAIVSSTNGNVYIYPGRGDLTFDAPVALPPGDGAISIVSADFNGDGRPDIAATTSSFSVDLFLNQGSLVFTVTSAPLRGTGQDIAAGDLNRDGVPDLAVADSLGNEFSEQEFDVLLGNGDGTFQPVVAHDTGLRGAVTIAIADFNHDGLLDVATGNLSWRPSDTECSGLTYWDSVTIVPGLGTGGFAAPSSFRLGSSNGDELYRNTLNAIAVADLNGDGWTDIVTSPGAVLLTHAPTANHVPIVSAGPDQMKVNGDPDVHFDAIAFDADNDWLEFEWRDSSGHVVGPWPHFCGGTYPGTYTVTVTDGHGGVATDSMTAFDRGPNDPFVDVRAPAAGETVSVQGPYTIRWDHADDAEVASYRVFTSIDDGRSFAPIAGCANLPAGASSCVWSNPGPVSTIARVQVGAYDAAGQRLAFATTDRFEIVSGPRTSLPTAWQSSDVGPVGEPGVAAYDGTTFSVSGSGRDIWGTVDEFQYVFTLFSGDFDVVARVGSVQNVSQWTKAGLMLREDLRSGARHASVFVTPSTVKGIAFQRRPTIDGESVSTVGPSMTAPVWLRLSRAGNDVRAYWRSGSSGAWTLIGTQTFADLNDGLQVGLAVSSHVHGTLARATFDHVDISAAGGSSSGWTSEDVGAVSAAGSASVLDDGTATVTGSGADIWGTADEFQWAYRTVSGNFSIEAQVDSVQNVNRWVKAGLMIRATHDPGSQHASLFVTPTKEKGIAFQGRDTEGGISIQRSSVSTAPSVWIRLTREGDTIEGYFRKTRTDPWQNFGRFVLTGLPDTVLAGLVVSSHVDGTLATAHFSNIDVEPMLPWATAQVGSGSSSAFVNGTFFSESNVGEDIWGTADAFTYIYAHWSGDGTITARLNDLRATDPWTKGGLMFRESLAPGSKHAFAFSSQSFNFGSNSKGLAEQYRPATNGPSASGGSDPGEPAIFEQAKPLWIRLTRAGNVFTSSISYDGVTFTPLGSATVAMPADILVGLALTSHDTNPQDGEAQALFDDVKVR
jgi:regulation of enolase protein 1 (concanavalin A-like superfamily)